MATERWTAWTSKLHCTKASTVADAVPAACTPSRCGDDPNKVLPLICGCEEPEIDTDGDGTLDCNDHCPLDPLKTQVGECGCGLLDVDTDGKARAPAVACERTLTLSTVCPFSCAACLQVTL